MVLMSRFFNFLISFLIHVLRVLTKISVNSLSFQEMWSVEEVHVSHTISIRKMSKRLSNQPTARLLGLHVSCLSWTKSAKNRGHVPIGHFILTVFINDSRNEPSHSSYSICQAIPKCYEFGDARKGNN